MRSLAALTLLSVLTAAPLAATCHDAAGNLLATGNCAFEKDVTGWMAAPGAAVTHHPAEHGVLEATADTQGSLTVIGPCLAAQPQTAYRIGARLRSVAGTVYFCSVNVFQHSDAQCTDGQEPLGSAAGPPASGWETVDGGGTTSPTAKSVQLRLVCSGEPSFEVQFDDIVLGKG